MQTSCVTIADDINYYAQDIKQDILRPSRIFTPFIRKLLFSIGLAILMVMAVVRRISVVAILSIIMLSVIFYIMFSNMSGDNISGSLPYATYPLPPHLGLDGVSMQVRSL